MLNASDLDGNVISDRSVEGCTGYYVLPPAGNPSDDRDYVGFASNATEALTMALEHKARVAVPV